MLTLDAIVQTQMMLNAQVTQIRQLSQKTKQKKKKKQQKTHKIILANHKLKLCETAEELKKSEGSVFTIWHEHLSMRKRYSKWVACLLTIDEKQQWVNVSEHCLQLFQCNKKEFLHEYVTIDDTWIYHFTSDSNRQSAEWTAAGESCSKQPKMQTLRFWPLYFRMHKVFYWSIILRKEEPSIANII